MDGRLRTYLEKAPPRPPLLDGRYADQKLVWLFPLGAALTGGFVVSQVVWDQREWWIPGALIWVALIGAAFILGRFARTQTQSFFRDGIFTTARVIEREVVRDAEDLHIRLKLEIEMPSRPDGYRGVEAGGVRIFATRLSDRWYRRDTEAPFEHGAELPALVGHKIGGGAKIFVGQEIVEAAETKASMAALEGDGIP